MVNCDMTDPNLISPGPAPTDLTNGSEAGVVSTLISAILKTAVASDVTYATGGALIYKLSSTAVTSTTYPLTINKATVTGETATDLIHYNSDIYVFYNHSGNAGDIAKLELTTDEVDPDWGSTIPTNAAELYDAPHYCCLGSDGVVYFTNGAFAGFLDGTTLSSTCLPLWTDSQAVSVSWNENRVFVAVNRPNVTGANFNQSFIVKWDGVNANWDGDPIDISGMIGALYTKNGTTFVWWQDGNTTNGYWFGYVNGGAVSPIKRYSGGLPNQTQVGEYEGFIMWLSSSKIMLWGAGDADVSTAMSHYATTKWTTTIGAIAAPFGSILGASYKLATFTAAVTNIITSAAHGLVNGNTVKLTTTTTLPGGLSLATTYYVISATTNTFKLSLSSGGSEVDITDTGTGTHSFYAYSFAKFSGYTTTSSRKTKVYNVSRAGFVAELDLIQISVATMSAGAKVDFTLYYDNNKSNKALDSVSYTGNSTATLIKILGEGMPVEDFLLSWTHENGSITAPVKIKGIYIRGHYVPQN